VAETGDRFEMVDGSVYIVRRPAAETNGEYVEMEFVLPQGSFAPPPHVHPDQVEEYEVIEGRFDVIIDGKWSSLGPGESASVPVGALHTFKNPTEETIRVRNWHRPAKSFEDFIASAAGALEAAGVKGLRDPRVPVIMSMQFQKFPDTLALGRARERIPMGVMARIGKLLRLPSGPRA
jgi:mannose-6-phosphate isomerase-like protein (cupin superfamily)